jgi:hypothetical protein
MEWRQSYGWSHLWSEEVAEHPENHTPDQETGHKLARAAARGLVTEHKLKLLWRTRNEARKHANDTSTLALKFQEAESWKQAPGYEGTDDQSSVRLRQAWRKANLS